MAFGVGWDPFFTHQMHAAATARCPFRSSSLAFPSTCRKCRPVSCVNAVSELQAPTSFAVQVPLAQVHPPPCPVDPLPNFRRMPRASCLTAMHEAQQLQARQPRLQVTDFVQIVVEEMPRDEKQQPKPLDDHRWSVKKSKQSSYLLYLQQLQTKLLEGFTGPAEYEAQLVYQVGLTERWLQLKYLLQLFSMHMSAPVLGAICRRLPELSTPKIRASFSPSEESEFCEFLKELMGSCRMVAARMPVSHASSVLFAMASLDLTDKQLCGSLVMNLAPQLGQATPANLAQIVWGLGRLRHHPGKEWLERLCDSCENDIKKFQPNQLWGVLVGLAYLGFVPRESWMNAHLSSVEEQLQEFTAEGLGNMIHALSIMQYKPKKLWMRSFVGMCNHKIKSFFATHLTQLVAGLSKLDYLPRPEVQLGILGQIRRQFHTFMPSQLATLLYSIASLSAWRPYRQFLYDFVAHSREKRAGWNVDQTSNVVWAFARFEVIPEDEYAIALLLQIQKNMGTASPENLAKCLWSLGRFRRRPNKEWLDAWDQRAEAIVEDFEAADVALSFQAFAALKMQPEQKLLEALLQQVLSCLSESSTTNLSHILVALVDMKYQPPELWLEAVVEEVGLRMPSLPASEYGNIMYGLAVLGSPVDLEWLSQLEREAYRKLRDMDGTSLVRLVWGMSQFEYSPQSEKWWPVFYRHASSHMESLSAQSLALLLVALGELITTAPPVELQLQLIKAIKARFPKPVSSADLSPMLQRAAMLPDAEGGHLPHTLWLERFVMELQRRWGLPRPT